MAKIPSVKGTRDFFPPQMAIRNWITDGWRSTSKRNGFVEYDCPIFENLQLYTQKSGDEIVSQLFSLTDRGGRDLAIRPEITPSLARMVNQQINSLPRPVKWFSTPRLCRAERPQKGRLREFFQWNCDVIGSDSVLADAECIYTAIDYLRSVGLEAKDVVAKISSRSMLAALLLAQGFGEDQLDTVYVLLDKRPKIPAEAFEELTKEKVPDDSLREKLMTVAAIKSIDELDALTTSDAARAALDELRELFRHLEIMGVSDYCAFDISIVRGLAYYTGPVFEIFDRQAQLRALCGGGRYDNLLAGMGGPAVPATGFGMGDVVLEILLTEKGKLGAEENALDFYVLDADKELYEKALALVCALRCKGHSASLGYKRGGVGKQMKQAANMNARYVIIIGQETVEQNEITVKDMGKGEQQTVNLDDFMKNPAQFM